jgi:hypothetical protein
MAETSALAPAPVLRLPALTVTTARSHVDAFRAETGGAPDVVPFTFPMHWLAAPEIAAALGDLLGPDCVPVHESQNFAYDASLAVDETYVLALDAEQTAVPARLILRGTVTTRAGDPCLSLETVLRLVPTAAAAS